MTKKERRFKLTSFFLILLIMFFCGCGNERGDGGGSANYSATANTLTDAEKAEGWQLLFDGKSFDGWRGLGRHNVPEGHWMIEDGCIKKVESGQVQVQADGQPTQGGDLMTIGVFDNYEFKFEWRVTEGANSGVKYNVSEKMSTLHEPRYAALGFEYQVLDDDKHEDGAIPSHRTASLYDMIEAKDKRLKPVGEWNESKIVFNGNHIEHWLNGKKVVETDLETEEFDQLLEASKYAEIAGFADRRKAHIVLQDHSDTVWYRNLKIRILPASESES